MTRYLKYKNELPDSQKDVFFWINTPFLFPKKTPFDQLRETTPRKLENNSKIFKISSVSLGKNLSDFFPGLRNTVIWIFIISLSPDNAWNLTSRKAKNLCSWHKIWEFVHSAPHRWIWWCFRWKAACRGNTETPIRFRAVGSWHLAQVVLATDPIPFVVRDEELGLALLEVANTKLRDWFDLRNEAGRGWGHCGARPTGKGGSWSNGIYGIS